jgi:hypothetical protein
MFQLVCDSMYKIVDCVVRWPGSVTDWRILKASSVWQQIENGMMHILGLFMQCQQ